MKTLLAGALEGDYHKGPPARRVAHILQEGVGLHRAIDGFTDRHPAHGRGALPVPEGTRRYAGILIDLSFDHLSSRHWEQFSRCGLTAEFSRASTSVLDRHRRILSEPARRMADRLAQYDVLMQYQHWDTVAPPPPASASECSAPTRCTGRRNCWTPLQAGTGAGFPGLLPPNCNDFAPPVLRGAAEPRNKRCLPAPPRLTNA